MKPGFLPFAFLPAVLFAHPMGSSSVNHYARIQVAPRGVQVLYVLDFGETMAAELRGKPGFHAEIEARAWVKNLSFRVNGRLVEPQFEKAEVAGPLLRVSSTLSLAVAPGELEYEDHNFAGQPGWKEIVVAAGPGAAIRNASVSGQDRSQALTVFPKNVDPPQELKARWTWTQGDGPPPSVPTAPSPQPAREDFLKQLLHRGEIGWQTILIGMAVAFGLGAVHALSPGHGKTIVAAYLVGNRGTAKHALLLGATVTFTHTFTVFALGLTTMYLYKDVLPERIFPVLGTISGLSIVWVGSVLLYKRARNLKAHAHDHDHVHDHGHGHDHHHGHDHGPHGHSHMPEGDITMGSLITLGASGGLVPCPSALVILLSSIALGRVALGLILLVGFSLGLAVVLMGIGLIVLYAKNLLPDTKKAAENKAFRIIPVLSAAVIVCLGLLMTGVSLGVIRPNRFIG